MAGSRVWVGLPSPACCPPAGIGVRVERGCPPIILAEFKPEGAPGTLSAPPLDRSSLEPVKLAVTFSRSKKWCRYEYSLKPLWHNFKNSFTAKQAKGQDCTDAGSPTWRACSGKRTLISCLTVLHTVEEGGGRHLVRGMEAWYLSRRFPSAW